MYSCTSDVGPSKATKTQMAILPPDLEATNGHLCLIQHCTIDEAAVMSEQLWSVQIKDGTERMLYRVS